MKFSSWILIFGIFFSAAPGHAQKSKVRVPTSDEKEQPGIRTYFNGTIKAEYDATNLLWPGLYRFYDKTHKVVCYSTKEPPATLSCAPSAAPPEAN